MIDGQTMRMISQLYAVKLSILYKYNSLFLNRKVKEGDIIYLQKKKKLVCFKCYSMIGA